VSKERAQRRAVREAELAVVRAKRARVVARRDRRRALARRLKPRLPDRRTGRLLARRTPAQRAAVAAIAVAAVGLIWLKVDSLQLRIALTLLVGVAVPVFVVLAFDRRI
jgi:hypothetical protein